MYTEMNLKSTTTNGFNFRIINSLMECWGVRVDYEYSPIFLRDSRASETRSRAKITPRGKRLHAAGIFLSPRRVSPFLAWGDFHARSRFARSAILEEKFGTTRSLKICRWSKANQNIMLARIQTSASALDPSNICSHLIIAEFMPVPLP